MAMSGGKDDGEPMMEMNTTPLIDVMLVLLIMFIITIPPITHTVEIDLPVQNNDPVDQPIVDPVINKIVILPDNTIQWNGTPVSLDQMEQFLIQTTSMKPEPELQFQPAPNAVYDTVDRALAKVKGSGITKFGFVGNEQYRVFGKAARPPN
ncbi:ExbD/TolR family protein [Sphingorhabdus arenilitoris]|uniref:ExbD/TolR family protein n=1 Tax=Sphingorhabdus arenilitoris TaxID=1490041 RepID=A0ABV8RLG7_9SPHN